MEAVANEDTAMLATPEIKAKNATSRRRNPSLIPPVAPEIPDKLVNPRKFNARKEQAALVRTIGKRLKEARDLWSLSQNAAAKRLGYNNPSRLSRLEKGVDNTSVPLWLIVRAAQVYEVTIDYLFGLTDDWEDGASLAERDMSSWLVRSWEGHRQKDLKVMKAMRARVRRIEQATTQMLTLARESHEAVERFRQVHPEFDDMSVSSKIVWSAERANDYAQCASRLLRDFKHENEMAALDNPQLQLF